VKWCHFDEKASLNVENREVGEEGGEEGPRPYLGDSKSNFRF